MDILSVQIGAIGGKAVSSGVTVNATTAALTLTTYQATVDGVQPGQVNATTAALILTTYSATIAGSFEAVVPSVGGRSKPRQRRIYEVIEPIIPETQEIPKTVPRRKVDVKKYEMVDIPKVISEGWKPKQKKQEQLAAKDYKTIAKSLPQPKKEEFDFAALEREAKEALEKERRMRIQEQNNLLMMLAMEEV